MEIKLTADFVLSEIAMLNVIANPHEIHISSMDSTGFALIGLTLENLKIKGEYFDCVHPSSKAYERGYIIKKERLNILKKDCPNTYKRVIDIFELKM